MMPRNESTLLKDRNAPVTFDLMHENKDKSLRKPHDFGKSFQMLINTHHILQRLSRKYKGKETENGKHSSAPLDLWVLSSCHLVWISERGNLEYNFCIKKKASNQNNTTKNQPNKHKQKHAKN